MTRNRTRYPIRLLLLCLLLLAAGCSESDTQEPVTTLLQSSSALHGSITVWSWNIAAKALIHATPDFERQHPGVHVDVEMTGARMQTRILLALAAGVGAPDVASIQQTDIPYFISTRQFTDLTPVAEKYRDMFPASAWNNCMLNGHLYAIPWDLGPCAVYYKRDLFRRYGIDPGKIKTWDDYIAAGQEILRKSGGRTRMLPLGINDLESMFELLIEQTGAQVFDSEGRIAINSAQSRQALEIIRRLRATGICSDVPAYSPEWMAGFNGDSIATYPGAFWLSGTIEDTASDYNGKSGNWGVFRLPSVTQNGLHVSNLGGSVLVIPAQCRNKAAAWAFVEYALCTREGQLSLYQSEKLFPAFLPALQSKAIDAPDPFFGGQRVGTLFSTGVKDIPPINRTKNWTEAVGYLQQDLSHWASTDMSDPEFFDGLERKLKRRLDEPSAPAAIGEPGGMR